VLAVRVIFPLCKLLMTSFSLSLTFSR
jgi:hypothetical protein